MGAPFKSYREESRTNWGATQEAGLDREQIKLGCLLRIADATEKMAANYTALEEERNRYKRWHEEGKALSHQLRRTIKGLRGYITRLKRKP